MLLIDNNGNYPRHPGDIQLEHPEWQEGDPLPDGWVEVSYTTPPNFAEGQTVEEGQPEEVNGVYQQTWVVRDLTQHELDLRDAPKQLKQKLIGLGLTEAEIMMLKVGVIG